MPKLFLLVGLPMSSKSSLVKRLAKDESLDVRALCRYVPRVPTDMNHDTVVKYVSCHAYMTAQDCTTVCKFPVGLYKGSEVHSAYINLSDLDGVSNYVCSVDITMVPQIKDIAKEYDVIVVRVLCDGGFILSKQIRAEQTSKFPDYSRVCRNFMRDSTLCKEGAYVDVDYTFHAAQDFESVYFDLHMLLFNASNEVRTKCL